MTDLRVAELLGEELGGRGRLPWKGGAEELRALACDLFGPPGRQPCHGSPLTTMAAACAAAAFRLFGSRNVSARRAVDIVVEAATLTTAQHREETDG